MSNWDGMLPARSCTGCGKQLNADGNHPAELYAGTYTGLCYTCEKKPFFVTRTEFDGALILSYPPHCPSWRRDRETFIAYDDCEKCHGKGRFMVSRSFSQGGPYPKNCDVCSARYHNNPIRRWRERRHTRLTQAAYSTFGAELKRHRFTGDEPEADPIRQRVLSRYYTLLESLESLYTTRTTQPVKVAA